MDYPPSHLIIMAAKIIAFCNFKGGVGKTLLAVNTAVGLADRPGNDGPLRVLLIDADPQANASSYALSQQVWNEQIYPNSTQSLAGLILRYVQEGKAATHEDLIGGPNSLLFSDPDGKLKHWPNLYLLSSHYDLADREALLHSESGQLGIPGRTRPVHSFELFSYILNPYKKKFDYILIDCPPNLFHMTQNALHFADHIIVPVIPDWLSTSGLAWLIKSLSDRFKKFGQKKRISAIVPAKWKSTWKVHNNHKEIIANKIYSEWPQNTAVQKLIKGCEFWDGLADAADVAKSVEASRPLQDYGASNSARNQMDAMVDAILKW